MRLFRQRAVGLLSIGVDACAQPARMEFVLGPSEMRRAMKKAAELGSRRKLLFPLDYEVVVVQRRGDAVVPADVKRAQHAMGPPRPTTTTFETHAHVSDYFVMDAPSSRAGVAIRHSGDPVDRIQWLTASDLVAARTTSIIHLQPVESLSILDLH